MIIHIGKLVYGREPSVGEAMKINLMLDIRKPISDILSSLRAPDAIESSFAAKPLESLEEKSQLSSMGTPLEKHFHEYARS